MRKITFFGAQRFCKFDSVLPAFYSTADFTLQLAYYLPVKLTMTCIARGSDLEANAKESKFCAFSASFFFLVRPPTTFFLPISRAIT